MSFYQKLFSLLIAGLFSLGVACGGGGSSSSSSSNDTEGGAGAEGGTGSALTVPDKVSVVDAQDTTSASLSALSKALATDLPADSDYNTVRTFTYVEESSNDALDIVNEIFCAVGQSGYVDMVNQGDYRAQIDVTQCRSENDSVKGQGEDTQDGSSGNGQTEYEFWTVNSFREDESSPHIVAAWIHMGAEEEFGEPAQIIEARLIIHEEPSGANPYGVVEMYFVAHLEDDPTQETFKGYLISEEQADGTIALKFYDHGEFEMEGEVMEFGERVAIVRDGSSILGIAEMEDFGDSGGEFFTYQFSADDNLFLRKSGGDEGDVSKCYNRDNYEETVHRYNVYFDETNVNPGALVERESGFSVVFIDENDERHHGYVGFWGAWFGESDVIPEHGDIVYKLEFKMDGPSTETPYTLLKSQGKLKKRTLQMVTLGEIDGVALSQHDCLDSGCTQYRVEWNGTDQKFYRTGTMDEENWIWQEMTPVAVTFGNNDWTFNGWIEGIGDIMVELRDDSGNLTALTNNSPVILHWEDVMYPNDSLPTTLICFESCPEPDKVNTSSPYFTKSTWESGGETYSDLAQNVAFDKLISGTHYVSYTFNAEDMVLEYNGTPIDATNSESEFGIWTGALFEPTQANLNAIACDWKNEDNINGTCAWEAFSTLAVYYSWESGANDWNMLTLLQDPATGIPLEFDPPLKLEYNANDGKTWFVDYNGPGDLGIPGGKCVDMDTGLETECGNWEEDKPIRWVPAFNISNGTSLTDTATNIKYYVKGIDKEQRMIPGSNEECAELEFTDSDLPELPDDSLWQAPDIGDEPALEDAAPAFIGGVPQALK